MKISILVPVYNEEKTIEKILQSLEDLDLPEVQKEIIVVDDGSTDNTYSNASDFAKNKKNIKLLQHKKNKGKGAAIRTGLEEASGDYVIIQDADLEYNPKYIKNLLNAAHNNPHAVVYGTRIKHFPRFKGNMGKPLFIVHYLGNRFLSLIASMLYQQWVTDIETCYKLIPKKTYDTLNLVSNGFEFEAEVTAQLLKKKNKIIEVPIATTPRNYAEGKKLHTLPDGIKALRMLIVQRLSGK